LAKIQLKGASKTYDKAAAPVVDDIDLDIEDGEFVVLLGPSGCGKTTTLRMIAGLEKLSAGELLFDGRLMNDVPGDQRNVGMVFQNYALYPHMTVFDNLSFGMRSRGIGRVEAKKRVAEVAGILDLDELLGRRPRQLSGGQRQRVALGRALVRDPAVFLMDEPLSNLDSNLREQTRMELARLHARLGITTVYVTHDQSEALTLADRVVVMEGGHVRQVDEPSLVYSEPSDTFVARFIGSPGMNLWTLPFYEEGAAVVCGDAARLPRELFPSLGDVSGDKIVLGVRPEHLSVDVDQGDAHFVCRVELQEHLGSHVHLHARLGSSGDGERLVARLAPESRFTPGSQIVLGAPPGALQLFDVSTGQRVSRSKSSAQASHNIQSGFAESQSATLSGSQASFVADGVVVG
jgi:ABC-type sugar transport system ATPase subunit